MSDEKITQNSLLPDVKPRTSRTEKAKPQQQEMFSAAETCAPAKGHIAPGWRGKLVLESEDPRTEDEKESDRLAEAKERTVGTIDSN